MADNRLHVVEDVARVQGPVETVSGLIADVIGWTQFYPSAVHAEYLARGREEDLVRQWSLAGKDSVRVWTVRRHHEPSGRRITFVHEPPAPPATEVRGEWALSVVEPGFTEVRMRHEFQAPGDAAADRITANIRSNTKRYLEALADTARRKAELDELIVSFEESLVIAGPIESAYEYLYAADRWPERIPHVTRLELEEPEPNIQFFDMDTKSPDGSTHTTRSVRVCQAPHLIVYKQIRVPDQLEAHTGHWKFTQTTEGVLACARHTATIRRSALPMLTRGETTAGARSYVQQILGRNSMSNLRLAKRFAEEQNRA